MALRPKSLLVGLAAALSIGAAFAQQSPSTPRKQDPMVFRSCDRNGDGVISPAEAAGSPLQATYSLMDSNDDGRLTLEEYMAFAGVRTQGQAQPESR